MVEDLRAVTDVEITNATSDAIATRGERLALAHARYSRGHGEPDPFHVDFLQLVEIDAGDRITALITFDPDDIDAAFAELDAYLAGEAAPYAHVWTAAAQVQAAYNRHEIPPTTADYVGIDHRRVRSFAPGDALPFLRATYDVAPNVKVHIEAVHRLNNLGVVITGMVSGTSDQGFAFELREVGLIAFKATWSPGSRCSTRQVSTPRSPALTNYSPRHRDAMRPYESGLQAFDASADHTNPVVQPVFSALPEFHLVGRDAVAAPVRRHRDLLGVGEARRHLGQLVDQRGAGVDHPGLV